MSSTPTDPRRTVSAPATLPARVNRLHQPAQYRETHDRRSSRRARATHRRLCFPHGQRRTIAERAPHSPNPFKSGNADTVQTRLHVTANTPDNQGGQRCAQIWPPSADSRRKLSAAARAQFANPHPKSALERRLLCRRRPMEKSLLPATTNHTVQHGDPTTTAPAPSRPASAAATAPSTRLVRRLFACCRRRGSARREAGR